MDSSGSSIEDDDLQMVILIELIRRRRRRRRRRARKFWVRPLFRRRRQQGEYHNLLQEMRLADPESHFRYMRMSKETFDSLLIKVCVKSSKSIFVFSIFSYDV